MKFWIVLCLLALSAAEEEDSQEKKAPENIQNTNAATPQTNQQFNQPFFSPTPLFGNKDAIATAPFTSFSGNIPNIPVQPINPEFYTSSQGAINQALPNFQVAKTVIPVTSAVPSGIQSQFPIAPNVLSSVPAFVNGINTHFPNIPTGIIPSVGYQGISPETLKYHPINSGVPIVSGSPYRVLPQEGLTNLQAHNYQVPQSIIPATLSSIQSYPSSVLTSLPGGIIPSSQGILKTPTSTSQTISNISNLPVDKINNVPLPGVFRHA